MSKALRLSVLLAWTYFVLSNCLTKQIWPFRPWKAIVPPMSAITGFHLKPWWGDLLLALLLAVAAIGIGGWILDRMRIVTSQLERVILAAGAGFAALAMMASAMALPGLFRPLPLRVLLVCFAIAGLLRIGKEARHLADTASAVRHALGEPLPCIALLLAGGFVWMALILAAAPEVSYDALQVYLPCSRMFLQHGTFAFLDLYRSNSPLYGYVFFALGEAFHDDLLRSETSARMLHFLVLPGLLMASAALARMLARNGTRVAAALAVLWVASSPIVWHHTGILYPDLGMTLWTTLTILATLRAIETRQTNWAAMAGWFAGMAAGTKFGGFYWIALCAAAILAASLFRDWRRAAIFTAVSLVVCSPWIIRNVVNLSDPVPPAFQKYLQHPLITAAESEGMIQNGLNEKRLPATVRNMLIIPWSITFDSVRYLGPIGPIFFWSIPFLLMAWRKEGSWLTAAVMLPAFCLLWFFGAQWTRYFLPALPLIAGLAAGAVSRRSAVTIVGIAMTLVNMPGQNDAWVSGGNTVVERVPYGVAFGSQSDQDFRRQNIPGYQAVEFLNTQPITATASVAGLPPDQYLPKWHSRLPVLDVWDNLRVFCRDGCYTSGNVLADMDRANVGVLAIRHESGWFEDRASLRLEDPLLRTQFRLLGYEDGAFLYLRDQHGTPPGHRYVQADLMQRWESKAGGPVRQYYRPKENAADRLALVLHTSDKARSSWNVALEDNPHLSFGAVRARWFLPQPLELVILIDGQPISQIEIVGREHLERWQPFDVDLSAWSGKQVELSLALRSPNDALAALFISDLVILPSMPDDQRTSRSPDSPK